MRRREFLQIAAGAAAPPGTPKEIISHFNAKVNEISATAEWKAKMQLVACIPAVGSIADMQKFWDDDWTSTAEVIKTAGIKLE